MSVFCVFTGNVELNYVFTLNTWDSKQLHHYVTCTPAAHSIYCASQNFCIYYFQYMYRIPNFCKHEIIKTDICPLPLSKLRRLGIGFEY